MKLDKFSELSALRVFVAVAEAGTLTQAADKLGVTQSAVSQTIKQMEQRMEVDLLARRSRPLKLTACGSVMYEYAKRLVDETQQMYLAVRMVSDRGIGKLRLGLIDSIADAAGQHILEKLIPFADHLTLRTGLVVPLNDALLQRDIDILLCSEPPEPHPELDVLPILRDPFVLLVADKYADKYGTQVANLARSLPFIGYSRELRLGALIQLVGRRMGVDLPIQYELDSTSTLLRFVQSGHGWAITPATCLLHNPALLQGVRILPVTPGSHARYVCLLSRKDEFGDLPARIADLCRDICTQVLVPQLTGEQPWLGEHIYAVEKRTPPHHSRLTPR